MPDEKRLRQTVQTIMEKYKRPYGVSSTGIYGEDRHFEMSLKTRKILVYEGYVYIRIGDNEENFSVYFLKPAIYDFPETKDGLEQMVEFIKSIAGINHVI